MDVPQLKIDMCLEFKKEIEFFKCGEIFITKNGIFRYDCILCGLKFESNFFIEHILSNHLSEYPEIINKASKSLENDNFSSYVSLSPINKKKFNIKQCSHRSECNNGYLKDEYFLRKYNIRKKLKISLERRNLDNVFKKVKTSITKLGSDYKTYKCSMCPKEFNNNIQLKEHKKIHLVDCTYTNKRTKFINSEEIPLTNNNLINKTDLSFNCNESKLDVILNNYIKNNQKRISVLKNSKQNSAALIYQNNCNTNETLDNKEARMRENEKHVCEICGKESTTKYNLNSHIRLKHNSDERKKYSCDHCKKTFVREQSLQNHIKIIHLKDKPFVCDIDKCERCFVDEKSLKNHQAFHNNERKFTCTKCGKKYLHKSKLDAHFKIYHVLGRIHQCKECNKSFYDPYTLRNHMICHTGEKPFACDECPARFPRENALQWHKKVHSGIKDHICKICGQSYHLFTGLYAHMKTHGIKYNKKIEKGLIPIEKLVPEKIISFKSEKDKL